MKKLKAVSIAVLFIVIVSAVCFAAENTYVMEFDGTDNWDNTLYGPAIDVETEPGSVRLLKSELIADEMGNMTDATFDNISKNERAKKEFIIDDPSADKATLVIYTNGVPKGTFNLEVNGTKNTVTFDPKRMLTGGWCRVDVDPKQLKKGLNSFVLYPAGDNSLQLYIDNCRQPNRSSKSHDSGANWTHDKLGEQGFCDGEYLIRLRLSHYPEHGGILSDFVPVGDIITNNPIKPVFSLKDIRIKADADIPGGTTVNLWLRGGSTPSYDPATWDGWKRAGDYRTMENTRHDWKYLQWEAVLRTKKALRTPSLKKVTVTIKANVSEQTGTRLSADMSENREIIRGYYNYAYQPFGDDRLEYLRKYFRLDEVVGGCSSEFEKFEVLATWLKKQ